MVKGKENGNGNGIYNNHLLLLDIDRPLLLGTHLTYVTPNKEVHRATVVQAGYYMLVVYNDDTSISIIGYADIVSVG
jgi:hypothetical protein